MGNRACRSRFDLIHDKRSDNQLVPRALVAAKKHLESGSRDARWPDEEERYLEYGVVLGMPCGFVNWRWHRWMIPPHTRHPNTHDLLCRVCWQGWLLGCQTAKADLTSLLFPFLTGRLGRRCYYTVTVGIVIGLIDGR